jgi:hypothetical protein
MLLLLGIINIKEIVQGSKAISSDDGDIVFNKVKELIMRGSDVGLDFEGIELVTTAFLNSSIGQLSILFPAEEIDKRIALLHSEEDIKVLIQTVKLRAIEYSSDSKGYGELANNAIYGS